MEQEATTTLRLHTTQKGKRTPPKKCEEERKAYQEREGQIMREIERDNPPDMLLFQTWIYLRSQMFATLLAICHVHTTSHVPTT